MWFLQPARLELQQEQIRPTPATAKTALAGDPALASYRPSKPKPGLPGTPSYSHPKKPKPGFSGTPVASWKKRLLITDDSG
jgi:hypothetical protein